MIVINRYNFKKYDISKVADALRGRGIEDSFAYKEAKEELIDMTMSCDRQECINALVLEARNVIETAPGGVDMQARADFLAAYDLAVHLNQYAFA